MNKYISVILGSVIIGVCYTFFFLPYNLITNGIFGLSQIFNHQFSINPAILILSINIIMLFMGLLTIGYEETKKYFASSILIPVAIYISLLFSNTISLRNIDTIILVISGAYLTGFGYSLFHKYGERIGTLEIINQIINKYRTTKKKEFTFTIEIIILILTFLNFGLETTIYSLIVIFLINYMSTKSKIGISSSKTFFIITTKEKEVKKYLLETLNCDYTEFNVKGGYTSSKNKIIMTVIDTKEYYRLKEGINIIDNKAFIFIIDNYETINPNVTINKKLKD